MPLISGLPLPVAQAAPWSNTAPDAINSLFTLWALDEADALNTDPSPDLAWAERGTIVKAGVSKVTYLHALPATGEMRDFDGTRLYHSIGAVARTVEPRPKDLSFGVPMVWLDGDTGWRLVTVTNNGSMVDVLGVNGAGLNGIPRIYVHTGKVQKAKHIADLFYSSMYCTAHGITSPTKFTYAQPNNPNGIALFSDGTGAAGSGGDDHYANPTNSGSARFVNVFAGYGNFKDNYGRSASQMTMVPNALFPGVRANTTVTDVIGPTRMQEKFWTQMISTLSPQVFQDVTGIAAAAVTNPYSMAAALEAAGITQENFLGRAFGPRRYWIAPQLDDHPYCQDNPNSDMWINLAVGAQTGPDLTWAKGAANNVTCTPVFRFYGPGDPQAQSARMARFEGDLDIGFEPGAPNRIAVFFEE
jgi:hypothetical protein